MSDLNQAIQIATIAHAGQVDKGGNPYIMHPIRVMLAMETEEERIVAILHDVLEDCPEWSAARLISEGFSPSVISALISLARRQDEPYGHFIDRISRSSLARKVKIADMRDNMDLSRIPNPTEMDRARVMKYERYIHALEA